MDQIDYPRQRALDDLRGLVRGEVRGNASFLQLYASDAGPCEITPLAVVRPRSARDVAACVRYAAENRIPIHARGAGSGTSGGAIGPGLVIDFSRHLRRIVRIEGERLRVQAGAVIERVDAVLASRQRCVGPDPPSYAATTIGGMIGVDASGPHWPLFGAMHDHLESVEAVLADGSIATLGLEPIPAAAPSPTRAGQLAGDVATILRRHAATVAAAGPCWPGGRHGYHLTDVLRGDRIDLPRLLCGSEGTLALITEATLKTSALPRHCGASLLLFDSLERAAAAVPALLGRRPAACSLFDRRQLSVVRETCEPLERLIPPGAEAAILIELVADDAMQLRDAMARLVDDSLRSGGASAARKAFDPENLRLLRSIEFRAEAVLSRSRNRQRPVALIEDAAVPPERLADLLPRVQNVLKRHEFTAAFACHAAQGVVRIQPLADLPEDLPRLLRLADEYFAEVFALGGCIGATRGNGLTRSGVLRSHLGPCYDVLCEIKAAFDPNHLLNPGKIIGSDAEILVRNAVPPVRCAGQPDRSPNEQGEPSRNVIQLQTGWNPETLCDDAADCVRCAQCRTQTPHQRMCPILRFAPSEEASPRAKANLVRGLISGRIDPSELTGDACRAILDLCVHCHCCRIECPSRVDIPRLVRESKASHQRARGMSRSLWVTTHLPLLAALGRPFWPLVNWALGNRWARWLIERTLGIAQNRKLPRLAPRTFLRRAARSKLTRMVRREGRKVAYFVDCFANDFDPMLGEALVRILKRNGIAVFVPPTQTQSGMPAIACGAVDQAIGLARRNVSALAEAVRQGYEVVATEPAAALCLKHEYPQLLENDDDALLVAQHSHEACSYLWQLHVTGELQLDLRPMNLTVGYHLPCHLMALEVGSPGEQLLRLIPGLHVCRLEEGCSGMAGTFGLLHQNYRNSLRAGWNLIARVREPRIQLCATECSACKMQMEQGTTKPTIHPLKLLAVAYDLLPGGNQLINAVGMERLITK